MYQIFDDVSSPAASGERVKALQRELKSRRLKGFLVPHSDEHQDEFLAPPAERLAWLTGFTGSAGIAIVLEKAAALFVDGRYVLQAKAQTDSALFEVHQTPEAKPSAWIAENLAKGASVGYDPARDLWICPADKVLHLVPPTGRPGRVSMHQYVASAEDCAACPLRAHCLKPDEDHRRLQAKDRRSAGAMRFKLRQPNARRRYARRKAIVEPVFGQLKEARGFADRFILALNLHLQPFILGLKFLVFLANSDESDIADPETRDAVESAVDEFLAGHQRVQQPGAHKPRAPVLICLKRQKSEMKDQHAPESNPTGSFGYGYHRVNFS